MSRDELLRTILMQDYIDLIHRVDALENKAVGLGLNFSELSKRARMPLSEACERLFGLTNKEAA